MRINHKNIFKNFINIYEKLWSILTQTEVITVNNRNNRTNTNNRRINKRYENKFNKKVVTYVKNKEFYI